jgi:lincosamide nucleotidyltransferase A/C/D/E
MNLSAQAAAELYELLRERGIRCWVMGGWGVDALVGQQTRDHHDLDVLLLGEDLPALGEVFRDHGFETRQVWEAENRWLDMDGTTWPTAFVAGTEADVELDVHVIELRAGVVVPLCNVPWPFDAGSLDGRGAISGRPVDCVSAQTQVAMHRGYELPKAHQRDVDLLRTLG